MATKIVTLTLTLGVVILLLSLPGGVKPVHCISSGDMESMLSALRARGYNLFSNAIATSDLQFDLLCTNANANANASNDDYFFTIFAPTDSALFALDMTQTAPFFTDTLRLHVVPKRLSFSQLQRLSSAHLRTLLPSRDLHVTTRQLPPPPPPPHPQHHHNRRHRVIVVSVDEIEVVFPGVYYSRYVAVHGLNGILTLRGPPQYSLSPVRSVLPQRTNVCSNRNRTAPPPPQPQQPPQAFRGYSPANSPSYLGVSPGLAPTIQSPESGNTASPSPSIGNGGHDDQDQLGQLWSIGW